MASRNSRHAHLSPVLLVKPHGSDCGTGFPQTQGAKILVCDSQDPFLSQSGLSLWLTMY